MNTPNKRERLVDSAAHLFHRNGLHATSLADIAKHAEIPIGNVYYYFKAKEELALAAVEKLRGQYQAAYNLLDEAIDDPRQRLIEAAKSFEKMRDEYARYGCPVGKMVEDADVAQDNVAKGAAEILADFVTWAKSQFKQLGHEDNMAESYATSLVSGIQGAAITAKAFQKPEVMTAEIERLVTWLESLPNRKIQLGKVGVRSSAA